MFQRRAAFAIPFLMLSAAVGCSPPEAPAPSPGTRTAAVGVPGETCTAEPAFLVKDLFPPEEGGRATAGSRPMNVTSAGGKVFFQLPEASGGGTWSSDGTAAGTQAWRATHVNVFDVGGKVLFFENGSLFRTNGTAAGTQLLRDFTGDAAFTRLTRQVALGGMLVLETATSNGQAALWLSDGTAAGTRLLGQYGALGGLAWMSGELYFAAGSDEKHLALWKSDGTPSGTLKVTEVVPGGSAMVGLELLGTRTLMFVSGGRAVYRTNGTASGTRLVMELPAGVVVERTLATSGQHYLIVDEGPPGKALWRTDGTDVGTVKLRGNLAGVSNPLTVGAKLFFALPRPDASLELWASDGTATGTLKALELPNPMPGQAELLVSSHVATNNQLYLSIHTVQNGARGPISVQLWRADGTATGTVKLVGPQLPEQGVEPPNLVAVNGTVVFGAKDPAGTSPDDARGQELWQSNGTRGGTFLIQELDRNGSSNPHAFTIAGSKIFFVARGTNSGFNLWALPVACVPAQPAPPREPPPPPPPAASGIRCPSDMVVEATGPDGAEVRFAATAINGPTPAYDHEPGSRFPLGVTQVTASTNGTNGPTNCSFTVTVRDTTAPQIFCAENLWVRTWKPGDAAIDYAEVGAWDAVSIPEVTYSQPPGSLFSEGTNEVVATATDAVGNQASCTLAITVQPITCAASPGSVSLWMLLAAAPLLWLRARARRQDV